MPNSIESAMQARVLVAPLASLQTELQIIVASRHRLSGTVFYQLTVVAVSITSSA